jgi:hypothetical protein
LGFTVLDHPLGFECIANDTLVFLPFAPWKIVLDQAKQVSHASVIITPDLADLDAQLDILME